MNRSSTFTAIAIALLAGAACPVAADSPDDKQRSSADFSAQRTFETWDEAANEDEPDGEAKAESAVDKEHDDKLKQCIAGCEKEKPEDRPMCIEGCNGQDFN